ncbi:MAG TPA: hypothetical protein VF816_12720 [Rhodocyclaceae bacterium]
MAGYHMTRGNFAFLSGVSLIVWSIVGTLTVLASWAIGGSDFKNVIFGDVDIGVFTLGVVVGAFLVAWAQHHGHRGTTPIPDRRHGLIDRRQAA